jgi:hypothetical protein
VRRGKQIVGASVRVVFWQWFYVVNGLVLVVPEVCARGYGAGRVRVRGVRGEERLVS